MKNQPPLVPRINSDEVPKVLIFDITHLQNLNVEYGGGVNHIFDLKCSFLRILSKYLWDHKVLIEYNLQYPIKTKALHFYFNGYFRFVFILLLDFQDFLLLFFLNFFGLLWAKIVDPWIEDRTYWLFIFLRNNFIFLFFLFVLEFPSLLKHLS
jgi:hypothetical protein